MNDDFTSAVAVEDDAPVENLGVPVDAPEGFSGDFSPLAQYYGYVAPTEAETQKLSYVWEYFAEHGEGPGQTLEALREMERMLAKPELGQSRLDRLYSYIRLVRAADDTSAELRAYLR